MIDFIKSLFKYFINLFDLWFIRIFLILDIITYLSGLLSRNISVPSSFYLVITAVGFILANIELFIKMDKKIIRFESEEANLSLSLDFDKVYFTSVGLDKNNVVIKGGVDKWGIPLNTIIKAIAEVVNTGKEKGELQWEIDSNKIKLPDIFDINPKFPNGHFNLTQRVFLVEGRNKYNGDYTLGLNLKEMSRIDFANQLSQLDDFEVPLKYWTKRIDSSSKTKTLTLKGNFEYYRQSIIKAWKTQDFSKEDT